jgi:tetratricopeptide (TPR) repeat protein
MNKELYDTKSIKIIDAFCTTNYAEVIRLCTEVQSEDPQNQIAEKYLSRVQKAWANGYGIPFDVQRDFYRAQTLAKLGHYVEAKEIYDEIQATLYALEAPRWIALEDALIELDRTELLGEHLEQANRLFEVDDWEEALAVYQQCLRIMPDADDIRTQFQTTHTLVEQIKAITFVLESSKYLLVQNPTALLDALENMQRLRIRLPQSDRLAHLAAVLDKKGAVVQAAILDAIEECVQLADEIDDLEVAFELVQNAKNLYTHLQRFPNATDTLDNLFAWIHACESKIRLSRDFATYVHTWLTQGTPQSVDFDNTVDFSENLAGFLKSSGGVVARFGHLQWLIVELEFCQLALACSEIQQIAALPNRIAALNLSPKPIALNCALDWQEFRESLLAISGDIAQWLQSGNPEFFTLAIDKLRSLRLKNSYSIFPMEQISTVIVAQWLKTLQHPRY